MQIGFGLVSKPPSGEARRALTLVAKILQNLVNGVEFGGKEQFMVEFNPFIINNATRITDFLNNLATAPSNFIPTPPSYTEEELAKVLSVVVKNMTTNFTKMENLALKDPRVATDPAKMKEVQGQLDMLKTMLV